MVENTIGNMYLAGIHSETLGFGNQSVINILDNLFCTYGSIGPISLKNKTIKISKPIYAHLPVANILKQLEDC